MNQKLLFSSALLVGIAGTQQALAQKKKVQDQKRPNVVFILADDLGFGDLSCYGQEKFETPNIDKLAQEGMRFTQCYSGTTVSAPSRSCLLTGTHSGHTAIRGNVELDGRTIPSTGRCTNHLPRFPERRIQDRRFR